MHASSQYPRPWRCMCIACINGDDRLSYSAVAIQDASILPTFFLSCPSLVGFQSNGKTNLRFLLACVLHVLSMATIRVSLSSVPSNTRVSYPAAFSLSCPSLLGFQSNGKINLRFLLASKYVFVSAFIHRSNLKRSIHLLH